MILPASPSTWAAQAARRDPVRQAGLPVVKKTASQPSTDEDVLTQLAEGLSLPKLLLEHRAWPNSRTPIPTSCR